MLPLINKQLRDTAPMDAPRWGRTCVLLAVSWVAVMVVYWNTIKTMVDVWAHLRTYAHGFLVLPATLYLV